MSLKLKNKLFKDGIKEKICEICKNTTWLGKEIPLQVHHIDGNTKNDDINNLQILCPNCHASTDNYCGKNKKNRKKTKFVPDDVLIESIKTTHNKRQALLMSGLTASQNNYNRIEQIMKNMNVHFSKIS